MHPELQRTLTSADATMTFHLDDQNRLLIKADNISYPFPLDNVTTLQLANMLRIFYDEIAQSAKPYNGEKRKGNPAESWSNWS
jgi:hypothetical protein